MIADLILHIYQQLLDKVIFLEKTLLNLIPIRSLTGRIVGKAI